MLVRREVLGLWPVATPDEPAEWWGRPWMGVPVRVVEDSADRLVTYVAIGGAVRLPRRAVADPRRPPPVARAHEVGRGTSAS